MSHWEIEADWFGPIAIDRVRVERFTEAMSRGAVGVYYWGAERGREFRALYVGQSEDPTERQRAHLQGKLGPLFTRIEEQRWEPLFWMAHLRCAEFCGPRGGRVAGVVLNISEKALIYRVKPEWNRANSGYMDLDHPIRLANLGRRPPDVPRVIRLKAGRHA